MPSQKSLVLISTAIFRAKFWFRSSSLWPDEFFSSNQKLDKTRKWPSPPIQPLLFPFSADAFNHHDDDEDETAGKLSSRRRGSSGRQGNPLFTRKRRSLETTFRLSTMTIGWTSRDRGPIVCTRQVKALKFAPTMDDAALRQERAALFD